MNDAAANGDHGATAQRAELDAEVQRRIHAALNRARLRSGAATTKVTSGLPVIVAREGNTP